MSASLFPHAVCVFFFILTLATTSCSADKRNATFPRARSFPIIESGNNRTLSEKHKEEIQGNTTLLLVPLLYLGSFLIGLPANLLALWVLMFHTKKFPSTILLINLTCCDLLLLAVVPFRIVYHFQGNYWSFGEVFCRLVTAIFYGNMYGSTFCLMLIAIDRYVALVHPFGAKTLRSHRTSMLMSVSAWAVVAAAAGPLLASQQLYKLDDPPLVTCHDALPARAQQYYFLPYFATLFFCCFLVPLAVVLFCYGAILRTLVTSGSRYGHAVRVTALVLVTFVVCLLPSNMLLIMHYSEFYLVKRVEDHGLYAPYLVSLALSTFNSCLDPFIFYYVSEDFREKARKTLCCSPALPKSSSSTKDTSSYSPGRSRSKGTEMSMSSQTTGLSH